MESVEKDVIEVNAKAGTRRFSVKNDEGCEFVTRQALKKLQGTPCNVSHQFVRCRIEGQDAKFFVWMIKNSVNICRNCMRFCVQVKTVIWKT